MHENHKEAVGALADAVTKWQAGSGVLWSELSRALREGGACRGIHSKEVHAAERPNRARER